MGQNINTIGAYNHGLGGEQLNLGFTGNPDDHSQYAMRIYQTDKYSSNNYYPAESPAVCTATAIGTAGAACTPTTAQVSNADGYLNNFVRLQQAWYQYTSPGGISVKLENFRKTKAQNLFSRLRGGSVTMSMASDSDSERSASRHRSATDSKTRQRKTTCSMACTRSQVAQKKSGNAFRRKAATASRRWRVL
jgi:hypothetical protein